MAILADTIKKLLTKAGFDLNSETYRQLIGIKELVAEIPDEVDQSLTTLMSANEAKNNIDIKKHFKAEALDPFNNKVSTWLHQMACNILQARKSCTLLESLWFVYETSFLFLGRRSKPYLRPSL